MFFIFIFRLTPLHPAQVSKWLSLFFAVRKDTDAACKATCIGVLSELSTVVRQEANEHAHAELLQSLPWPVPLEGEEEKLEGGWNTS